MEVKARFGQDKMKQRDGRELNVQSEDKRVWLHCCQCYNTRPFSSEMRCFHDLNLSVSVTGQVYGYFKSVAASAL